MHNTKVVGPDGKPRMVYHGTGKSFERFSDEHGTRYGLFGPGHYFTESESSARFYAENNSKEGEEAQIHSVYLNIESPVRIDSTNTDLNLKIGALSLIYPDGQNAYDKYVDERSGKSLHRTKNEQHYRAIENYFIHQSKANVEGVSEAHARVRAPLFEEIAQSRCLDYLEHLGYDGIQDGLTWICFRDNQIHHDYKPEIQPETPGLEI